MRNMIRVNDSELQRKIEKLYQMDQGHIFRFWEELNEEQRNNLLDQVRALDIELLADLIQLGIGEKEPVTASFHLEPAEVMTLKQRQRRDTAVVPVGEKALREGQVAAFLVAGGQGTRLGFNGPKGAFPITPVKQKPLFQLHAEKIRAVSEKYGCIIPWYIMTSQANHETTVSFFEKHHYFGLPKEEVMFFRQDMLPAIDFEGKLLLAEKDSLFLSPNGHGGSVKALWDSGALENMKQRGIRYIFYFQVDNVLVNICDPAFIGYHIASKAQMSNKVVRKAYPEERMGIICKINGKMGVVEYSDLSQEDMFAIDEKGELKYWAGSIAIHMLNVDFIEQANKNGFSLPYHKAVKIVPFVDSEGWKVQPNEKNGIKFETFVFDLLLQTDRTFTLEVDRCLEFSPVKNKDGLDSPITARQDLLRNYAHLLNQAGIGVPVNICGLPSFNLEISPLFALTGTDVKRKKDEIKKIVPDLYLE